MHDQKVVYDTVTVTVLDCAWQLFGNKCSMPQIAHYIDIVMWKLTALPFFGRAFGFS